LDEIARLRALADLYENALEELERLGDPGLEELVIRLRCRAAIAAYEYAEYLRPLGASGRVQTLPRRDGR
jgi:hypothetical protein